LNELGFNLVGYGCTTCIGNSGPLPSEISDAIGEGNLVACSVLSGNRNFEGRISPHVRANYLASPPLVVAYALAGSMDFDLYREPLGVDGEGREVFLKDIWPTQEEVRKTERQCVKREMYVEKYADVYSGDKVWRELPVPVGSRYQWKDESTYIKNPPFFENMPKNPGEFADISGMRALAVLGDSVTTDHISPAGGFPADGPAGQYLIERGVAPSDFNSFGSRRGNHEVMMRGTFANIRLRNELVPGVEGGFSRVCPDSKPEPIYDVAMKHREKETPLIVIAGKEYGSGSSRDWAAKGTRLLGVRVVVAESYERIHRSNLIGMGVLPVQFLPGEGRSSLGLTGFETFDLTGLAGGLEPGQRLTLSAVSEDGDRKSFEVIARVDTPNEVLYLQHGGILHFVLRSLAK
jgi:aconitate hydratase